MDRRRSLGQVGEEAAAAHLRALGYEVVARNYRTRFGELDIVAAGERAIVFLEVKTRVAGGRRGPATALEAVGPAKRGRVRRMAAAWLAQGRPAGLDRPDLRFDAIGVTLSPSGQLLALEHVERAF